MSHPAMLAPLRWYATVAISLLTTATLAEFCLRQYFRVLSPKHASIVTNLPRDTTTLIIGSSHVFNGVNSSRLPPHYAQIAVPGINYSTIFGIVCKHITADSNIKHLLVELDPFLLYFDTLAWHGQPGAFVGDVSVYNYLTVKELVSRDLIPPRHVVRYGLAEHLMALRYPRVRPREVWEYMHSSEATPVNYTRTFRALHNGMTLDSHKKHYKSVPGRLNSVAQHALYTHRPVVESNRECLLKTIKHCHNHEVLVVLFTVPHSSEYWSDADKEYKKYFEDIVSKVRSMSGVIVMSPNWSREAAIDDFDMHDPDHLDPNGAEKFTHHLLHRLRKSGL